MPNRDPLDALGLAIAGLIPTDAVPFNSKNATLITTTTAVEIKAATALKSIYVTKLQIQNRTITEAAVITIQDDAATPVEHAEVAVSTAAGNSGFVELNFWPPLQIAVGQALDGVAGAALGDTVVHASGFVGTPA
jgi:hypothetical protein